MEQRRIHITEVIPSWLSRGEQIQLMKAVQAAGGPIWRVSPLLVEQWRRIRPMKVVHLIGENFYDVTK